MSIKSLTIELLEPSKSSNIPKKSSVQYDNLILSDLYDWKVGTKFELEFVIFL